MYRTYYWHTTRIVFKPPWLIWLTWTCLALNGPAEGLPGWIQCHPHSQPSWCGQCQSPAGALSPCRHGQVLTKHQGQLIEKLFLRTSERRPWRPTVRSSPSGTTCSWCGTRPSTTTSRTRGCRGRRFGR